MGLVVIRGAGVLGPRLDRVHPQIGGWEHSGRSRQRRRTRESNVSSSRPLPVGPDHSERIAIRELVNNLDPDQREAFVLTQMLGLTYDEAADISSCPVGTVRSRVNRARSHLIGLMNPDTEQPGDTTVVSQRGLPSSS